MENQSRPRKLVNFSAPLRRFVFNANISKKRLLHEAKFLLRIVKDWNFTNR